MGHHDYILEFSGKEMVCRFIRLTQLKYWISVPLENRRSAPGLTTTRSLCCGLLFPRVSFRRNSYVFTFHRRFPIIQSLCIRDVLCSRLPRTVTNEREKKTSSLLYTMPLWYRLNLTLTTSQKDGGPRTTVGGEIRRELGPWPTVRSMSPHTLKSGIWEPKKSVLRVEENC